MDKKKLEQRLTALKGHIGFYYKNLVTGETYQYHSEDAFEAASLPKLALLLEVLRLVQEGVLHLTDKVKVKDGDKVGGCGALKSFPGDLEVDIAGKTGTAEELKNGHIINHAFFVSFAPYQDPEIAVTVNIPYGYSSSNAATAAKNIYRYYYGYTDLDYILNNSALNVSNVEIGD